LSVNIFHMSFLSVRLNRLTIDAFNVEYVKIINVFFQDFLHIGVVKFFSHIRL